MNLIPKNLSQLRRIALSVLLASFAILDTTSISAQELGKTITSPFGVANPYMNASDASESGTDGDTFVDPETGEVGHIIRNPFGVANPNDVDTGIDIPDSGEEEVGGIITSPFGVPASDDIDTGVDVFDEDEEYLISLPDDEESDAENSEDVDEVDDETSDDEKEIGEESYEATTEKYVPVIDNPIRGVEHPSFNFELTCSSAGATVTDSGDVSVTPTLCVLPGKTIQTQAVLSEGSWPSGAPTWTLTCQTYESLPYGVSDLSLPSYANGMSNPPSITVPSGMPYRKYILTASAGNQSRSVQIVVLGKLDLQIDSNNDGIIEDNDDSVEETAPGKIIFTNDGDLDQDGIPDCYDGFDILCNGVSQAGNMKSEAFTPIKIYMRGLSDLIASNQNVSIRFSYVTADPRNEAMEGEGTDDNPYVFTDGIKGLRIWTKDGTLQRKKKSLGSSGDYVPSNTYISLSSYKNANVITSDTINLFVEAKNEPDPQAPIEITCSIKINSSTSNVMSDKVKVSSVRSFIWAIDVSGYMRSNLEIERIPVDKDVDGIATDHLSEVNDGSALLLCFAVTPPNSQSPNYSLENYFNAQSVSFDTLASADGTLERNNIPSQVYSIPTAYQNGIPHVGDLLPDGRKVIKQALYTPPLEMGGSPTTSNNAYRTIDIVANVSGLPNMNGNYEAKKELILTRPPVLMVHGINGTSENVFNSDTLPVIDYHLDRFRKFKEAMNDAGFMPYAVDHNNDLIDPFSIGEYSNIPTYRGNGDIVTSYQFLRDRICHNNSFLLGPNESPERDAKIKPVLPMYRTGEAIQGKKIAIQKVDVVAYSYGGLLARWYVEKSSEFSNRRDVRKIITIGTPHRGSPITNMMCESYKNSVFADAISGWPNAGLTVREMLEDVFGRFILWHKGIHTPGSSSANDFDLYEALHVIAHNSLRLQELNSFPLNSDVAYASIVGTDDNIYYVGPGAWSVTNPKYNYYLTGFTQKSYFPWAEGIETQSDGIVPQDSQMLVDEMNYTGADYDKTVCYVSESHVTEVMSTTTQDTVISWLKNPSLELGRNLRHGFNLLTQKYNNDRYDIYSQQSINFSNQYEDTGVNPDAIVQTVLTMPASNPSYLTDNILGPHGGVVTIKCTGMVPDNGRTLSIIADGSLAAGYNDTVLHGPFSLTGPACPYGIYLHKLKSFSITGTIGRSICSIPGIPGSWNELRGPNDYVGVRWDITDSWDIGYEIDGSSYYGFELQSPPTRMEFSTEPVLDPLVKEETSSQPPSQPPFQISGPTNFIARGGFHVSEDAVSSETRTQQITIKIYDEDTVLDDLLVNKTISVVHALNVFAGILMPYETSIELTKDSSGHISGAQGSSGESTAQVYQELIELSGISNPESQTVDITAN
jgi:Predicted acetyltransferases and hydrolases with the alpha/beta hydrolase fold